MKAMRLTVALMVMSLSGGVYAQDARLEITAEAAPRRFEEEEDGLAGAMRLAHDVLAPVPPSDAGHHRPSVEGCAPNRASSLLRPDRARGFRRARAAANHGPVVSPSFPRGMSAERTPV